MVLSASVLWSVFVFTFHVTAWKTRASLQTPLFPLMMTAVACGAVAALGTLRLWLFVLPSRLMKKTSIPTVIKAWFDGRHGLPCLCVCYATWLLAVGIVGRFNSFSVTLSKAIRDSERSTPTAEPSPSSHENSPVARAVTAKGLIIRLWERLTCGGIGGIDGGIRGGGAAGIVPKTGGVYAKTKSMLKKLTVASFADTPLVFFMTLYTTMPSVWLIVAMRFLARDSTSNGTAAAAAAAPSPPPPRPALLPTVKPGRNISSGDCNGDDGDVAEGCREKNNEHLPSFLHGALLRVASKYRDSRQVCVRVTPTK
ncbi:unnamed protein product [Ectocarpus sp. 12 AP-2014]